MCRGFQPAFGAPVAGSGRGFVAPTLSHTGAGWHCTTRLCVEFFTDVTVHPLWGSQSSGIGAQHRKGAAHGCNLLSNALAGEVYRHVECLGQRAVAQELDGIAIALHKTGCAQLVLGNRSAGFKESLKLAQVDDGDVGLEAGIVEALLGQSAMKGHLATFETGADGAAGASLLALVALAAGLTQTGAFTAPEALLAMLGAGIGLKCVKCQHDV